MKIDEKSIEERIIHSSAQSLTVRSAALVARGLRDLASNSNWHKKQVFAGSSQNLAISPVGQVCVVSARDAGVSVNGTQRVAVYNIEEPNTPANEISTPKESTSATGDSSAELAWSPTGQYLVAAFGSSRPELHLFDPKDGLKGAPNTRTAICTFGAYSIPPNFLAWSDAQGYFAAVSRGGKQSSMRVWRASVTGTPLSDPPLNTLRALDGIERQTYEAEFGEEGAFLGYGKTVFSPDEQLVAVTLEFKGDWADDSIQIVDVPSLQKQKVFQAQGHITDLSWTPDGQQIIYCAGGQSYRLAVAAMTSDQMQFGAELCVCHPFLPLCVCFSSWLKDSAKGRLAVFDLDREEMFDECAAEGIVALRWSADGSKAYAMTKDGLGYVYESPAV